MVMPTSEELMLLKTIGELSEEVMRLRGEMWEGARRLLEIHEHPNLAKSRIVMETCINQTLKRAFPEEDR